MLPQKFIDKYKPKIKESKMFGIPIEKLSKEELLLSLAYMGEIYTKSLERNTRNLKF